MKPGITFISERTKQFRYVDDNEQKHFLTQCSEYRVAKPVKRGMPVSIYSYDEMERDIEMLTNKVNSFNPVDKNFTSFIRNTLDKPEHNSIVLNIKGSEDSFIEWTFSKSENKYYLLTNENGNPLEITFTNDYYYYNVPTLRNSDQEKYSINVSKISEYDLIIENISTKELIYSNIKNDNIKSLFSEEVENLDSKIVKISEEEYQDQLLEYSSRLKWIQKVKNSNESYIVPSNIWRHNKVVGLALEPCIVDYKNDDKNPIDYNPIHIQSTGTFYYDLPGNSNYTGEEFEYYPTFSNEDSIKLNYKDCVGKAVYVKGDLDNEDSINGEITVLEEYSLLGFENTIHLGYITDSPVNFESLPNPTDNVIKVELQLNGDVRGPIDHTQFILTVADEFEVSDNDQIRVFAIGNEDSSKFSFRVAFDSDKTTYDSMASTSRNQWFAIRNIFGKVAFVTFNRDQLTPTIESIKNSALNSEDRDKDRAFIKSSNENNETVEELITFFADFNNIESFRNNLHDALSRAFSKVAKKQSGIDMRNDHAEPIEYNPTKLNIKQDQFPDRSLTSNSFSLYLEADDASGYYEFYVSEDMKKLFSYSEQFNTGSVYNKGCAVLADNRIPARTNLIGLYNGKVWGKRYKIGDQCIFLKNGTFETSWKQSEENKLIPGKRYYLGQNGKITDEPGKYASHVTNVGVATYNNTIIVDVSEKRMVYNGDLPVGHIKPSVNGHAEYGYILADGITPYDKNYYSNLYTRLKSWYPEKSLQVKELPPELAGKDANDYFIVPNISFSNTIDSETNDPSDSLSFTTAQIKWMVEGIYEDIKHEPFERFFGTFNENSNIEECDITLLTAYGPIEEKYTPNSLEYYDIRLFVDLNEDHALEDFNGPYEWTEVKEGLFTFNNTETFGFRWKVEEDGATIKLLADLQGSNGIAAMNKFDSPPKLLKGLMYKVWVYRREIFPRTFDMSNVLNTATTSKLLPNSLIPTGKAVINYINDKIETNHLIAGTELKLEVTENSMTIKSINDDSSNTVLTINSSGIFNGEGEDNKLIDTVTFNDHVDIKAFDSRDSNESYKELTTENSWRKEGPHNIVFGYDGNVHASSLQGFFVKSGEDKVNGFTKNGYIPYVNIESTLEGNSDETTVELSIAGQNNTNKTIINTSQGKVEILPGVDDLASIKVHNLTATDVTSNTITASGKINANNIEAYNRITSPYINASVEITVPNLGQISSITIKKLFYEDINSFTNADVGVDISQDIIDKEGNSYSPGQEMSSYLQSSLQALYELPLAVFKYNNQLTEEDEGVDENSKPFVGVIIERLTKVREIIDSITSDDLITDTGISRKYFESSKEFTYTKEQLKSISKYIELLTDKRDSTVNINTTVGVLLAAAKETQERLLAIESSTFGDDYSHIPGSHTPHTGLPNGVSQTPTILGLNRLVRALCQEIFYTADPGAITPSSGEHTTALSRIDALDQSIHGEKAINNDDDQDDGSIERIRLESEKGITYPRRGVDENIRFDGLNDSVNRIVDKLNTLTSHINGIDDIKRDPKRLDTIRSNITLILKDTYWINYIDSSEILEDGTVKNDVFDSGDRVSRLDKITEELYKYSVNYNRYISDKKKNNIGGTVNEIDPELYDLFVPKDEENNESDDIENYTTKWSIIDLIKDVIGSEELLRREFSDKELYSSEIWDPTNETPKNENDSRNQKQEFKFYNKIPKNNLTKVSTIRDRINKTILERLLTIELILDNVANRLVKSGRLFEEIENNKDDNYLSKVKSIEEFLLTLQEWSGIEYKEAGPKGDGFYIRDQLVSDVVIGEGKYNVSDVLNEYTSFWPGLKASIEDYVKVNDENKDNDKEISVYDDVKDLLQTIYGYCDENNNVKFSHRSLIDPPQNETSKRFLSLSGENGNVAESKNIIESIVNHLYKTHNKITDDVDNLEYFDFDTSGNINEDIKDLLSENRDKIFNNSDTPFDSRLEEFETVLRNLRLFIGLNDFDDTRNKYGSEFKYTEGVAHNSEYNDQEQEFYFNGQNGFSLSDNSLLGLIYTMISSHKSLSEKVTINNGNSEKLIIDSSVQSLKNSCDAASSTIDSYNIKNIKSTDVILFYNDDNNPIDIEYDVEVVNFTEIPLQNGNFKYSLIVSDDLSFMGSEIMIPSNEGYFYNNEKAFIKENDYEYIEFEKEILDNGDKGSNLYAKSILKPNKTKDGNSLKSYVDDIEPVSLKSGLNYIGKLKENN